MDFRLELKPKSFQKKIELGDAIFLVGSCFTEHISKRLALHKFPVLENPNGILFNPISIQNAVERYAENKPYSSEDLFFYQDLFCTWQHHGQFAEPNASKALQTMNANISVTNIFLQKANWAIITLGSSWVYETTEYAPLHKPAQVAANCHKMPANFFNHRLLQIDEVKKSLKNIVKILQNINAEINIIFTISPVRHAREGLVENNRSKALLITAVHDLIATNKQLFYFPAYELMIDDLRDYRFYAEDMVHPNYQATQYVWDKFLETCIDEKAIAVMQRIYKIVAAKNHKPLHPNTKQHQLFLQKMLAETEELQRQFPSISFKE